MYPTCSLDTFAVRNYSDVDSLVGYFCRSFNWYGSYEDIVQDLFLKFKIKGIIEKYDFKRNIQISSYLYRTIRNHVLSYLTNNKKKNPLSKSSEFHDYTTHKGPKISRTFLGHSCEVTPEYKNHLECLASQEYPEGSPIKDFETYLSHSGRNFRFKFSRRKDRDVTIGCTLLDLFRLMYEGYTSKEIAVKYGVTHMSVFNMKAKLIAVMSDFGIKCNGKRVIFE